MRNKIVNTSTVKTQDQSRDPAPSGAQQFRGSQPAPANPSSSGNAATDHKHNQDRIMGRTPNADTHNAPPSIVRDHPASSTPARQLQLQRPAIPESPLVPTGSSIRTHPQSVPSSHETRRRQEFRLPPHGYYRSGKAPAAEAASQTPAPASASNAVKQVRFSLGTQTAQEVHQLPNIRPHPQELQPPPQYCNFNPLALPSAQAGPGNSPTRPTPTSNSGRSMSIHARH